MNTTIIIPARWASKRFPGKPLAMLGGKEILRRVWEIADAVCREMPNCRAAVATERREEGGGAILDFCHRSDIPVIETSAACRSGSDRAWEAVRVMREKDGWDTDVVLNLQGDNPFCPPGFLTAMISAFREFPGTQVATPFVRLSWEELDALREAKKTTPGSGTTVIVGRDGNAQWFSKNIIPAIRGEEKLRAASGTVAGNGAQRSDRIAVENYSAVLSGHCASATFPAAAGISPVCRHVGLYAYRVPALAYFAAAPAGEYEKLEQLEQLRFLENGLPVRMVEVAYPAGWRVMSGIDSPEDLSRAEGWMNSNEPPFS